jgi:hypothetical protein
VLRIHVTHTSGDQVTLAAWVVVSHGGLLVAAWAVTIAFVGAGTDAVAS